MSRTKMITIDAVFIALIMIFTLVPYIGYIPMPTGSATLIHVFVIIGAAMFGWRRGLIYGFVFGLFSMIKAYIQPNGWFDVLFQMLWISILPRMLFGLISGLLFDLVKRFTNRKVFISLIIPIGFLATLIHSILVLGTVFIIDGETIKANMSAENIYSFVFITMFGAGIGASSVIEAVIGSIIPFMVCGTLFKYLIKYNGKKEKVMKNINYKELTEKYYSEAIETIKELVSIDSVYDDSTVSEEKPYGNGVYNALVKFKEFAESKGFEAEIVSSRCVEVKIGKKGKEVGIFGHLDVVPATGKWKYGPFTPTIEGNKLYGRGTFDDKGPLVIAFYSVLALKEANLLDGYRVRIVAGGDEERGSSCLEHYFHVDKKKDVDCGFTPDADFPLIYGEKGITNYTLSTKLDSEEIVQIKAGVASNVVIDRAMVKVKNPTKLIDFCKKHDIKYEFENDFIVFLGVSAHGSTPELGINAGVIMLKVLGEVYDIELFKKLSHDYSDYNGRNLNHYYETKDMGVTTYNVGVIGLDNGNFFMTVNFRYPENVEPEKVAYDIAKSSNLHIQLDRCSPVLYFDPTTPMIETLYNAYQEETGDKTTPKLTIGGGTYAKEAKNIIAFGATFPGTDNHIHDADEFINLDEVKLDLAIYARAIHALGTSKK